jgi:hypothetical protein
LVNPAKLGRHLPEPFRAEEAFGDHRTGEGGGFGQERMARMPWPLRNSSRVVSAMSSCNVLPVIMEISPTTIAGCIAKRSCNASGPGQELTPCGSGG